MVGRALALILLAVFTLAGCDNAEAPSPRLQVGDVLPPLSVVDLKGQPQTLRPSPGKLLILNLWATWCAPCREELPSLQRLAAKLDPARFELLLLSVDDDEHRVREFLIDRKVHLVSLLDPDMSVSDDILGIRLFPSTYFVSPDGRIAVLMEGAREWDSAEILAQIEAMHPVR